MSTTPGLHAPPPTQYVHYTTVSPADTQHQKAPTPRAPAPASPSTATVTATASPTPNANASASATTSTSTAPVVAKGNWTKDLVQLAKTAELKKHALTLQLHTAHILSAHASLEQKNRAVQDIREQKNKLESERVNEDRDKADLLESGIDRECTALRSKIATLSAGEYAAAKADVDRLRADLGQPPLPSLQSTLDEKGAQ
ncbi:hypothetical protein B0H10DRAFT_2214511 [Mycena sp. CBHHK59/15]|nr:hypothetical protein B0H10DRAFT_2214511 [Mycena sp. CBHHK59/15]